MSDDDCDIFNLPVKRLNAAPQKQFVEDQESRQTDYDFIKSDHFIKKPAKVTKPKSKARAGNRKKQTDEEESNNNEMEEAPAPATRAALSPVSQLIYEMEQRQDKTNAKATDALPVARRTRSSLGKRLPTPEQDNDQEAPVAVKVSPPKKRNVRGKKSTVAAKTRNSETVNIPASSRSRQQTAEFAARSRIVDSIDLVSAVFPRIEGFVNLDSDEEDSHSALAEESAKAVNSFDDDNPIIEINLNWLGEMQLYKLRQHQKFAHMFKEVSKRNVVPVDDIVINMDDLFISPTESPISVGVKVYHILSGRAIKSNKNKTEPKQDTNLMCKPKKFQLKVQCDKWKQPLIIPMKKTETFKILYIKCAEEMECDVQGFKLFFDGELLEPDDTPKNQDMEGNEVIDFCSK
ncbi:DNA repair protein Rad60 [Drosophila montana]|uniref:DNA repair protein Rad60 n=1 Tax=Drosophila montana TaxID=40370 RepID=UPI00313D81ED